MEYKWFLSHISVELGEQQIKAKNTEDITWPRGDMKFIFEC